MKLWSEFLGMATLQYDGISLSPSRIYSNGTWLGGWVINTNANLYCGSGQFDDGKKAIVVMSSWGMGVLSLQNNTHLYIAPNATRFGGWLLNSGDNVVRLIADFDADGKDEILISSPGE
ncbi:MAG: hypothetical protein WKG06_10545 [Segetibacter sp.]